MEHRRAVIHAADVVGYLRHMKADEEAKLATMNAYRQVSHRLTPGCCCHLPSNACTNDVDKFARSGVLR